MNLQLVTYLISLQEGPIINSILQGLDIKLVAERCSMLNVQCIFLSKQLHIDSKPIKVLTSDDSQGLSLNPISLTSFLWFAKSGVSWLVRKVLCNEMRVVISIHLTMSRKCALYKVVTREEGTSQFRYYSASDVTDGSALSASKEGTLLSALNYV